MTWVYIFIGIAIILLTLCILANHIIFTIKLNKIDKRLLARRLAVELSPLYSDWLSKLALNGHIEKTIIDTAWTKIIDKIEENL